MDVNEGSLKMLEFAKNAINASLNNGKGSKRDYILEIKPGPIVTKDSSISGLTYTTCDDLEVVPSWTGMQPDDLKINVRCNSVSASLTAIMEWARKHLF